jgi:hypothetical protein
MPFSNAVERLKSLNIENEARYRRPKLLIVRGVINLFPDLRMMSLERHEIGDDIL